MRKSRFTFLVGVSLLSSAALTQGASAAQSSAYSESFSKAFRTAFRARSISQCVARVGSAATSLDFTPTCSCAADTLLATKSVNELASFGSNDADHQELRSVVKQCLSSDPPVRK